LENLMLHLQKDNLVHGYKRTTPKIMPSTSDNNVAAPPPAKSSIKIYKYPRILVIQLKRYDMIADRKSESSYSSSFINKHVIYERYMTVKEGTQNTLVTYKQIGLIVFEGRSLDAGHYFAYVLNSENKWYKKDDLQPNEVPVTAYKHAIKNYLTSFL